MGLLCVGAVMDARVYFKRGLFCCLISSVLTANSIGQAQDQATAPPHPNGISAPSQTAADNAADVDPGSIDKLLDIVDKDISQLPQVSVAGHTGSASLDMPVSTVDRVEKPMGKTGAAVYVLTNEMIKRTGARNVPEALRYVPGLQVARINANSWAISTRGFNSEYADKLLIQIDGRAIFQPITNGVFWDQQFVMLEDVDRIEIIRGAGGAIWGMNAVNGIINIVTKSTTETKGVYADVGGGDQHQVFSSARVGGQDGDFTWRVWGTQNKENHGFLPNGAIPTDGLSTGQGGFRTDWQADQDNLITFQGDWLGGLSGTDTAATKLDAANTLVRWNRKFSEESDQSIQMYYDYFNRTEIAPQAIQNVKTFDFDYKYHVNLADRHDVVVGGGYRNYSTVGEWYMLNPNAFSFKIISYFVQDTITLRADFLYTTFGCKFAHEDLTNFEYQPCWKLVMTPNEKTSIWTSISRSVGIPSINSLRLDRLKEIGPGRFVHLVGDPTIISEDAMTYEIGFRRQATEKFYWDISTFFNRYDNLVGFGPLQVVQPYPTKILGNINTADTYGFEWTGNYQVTDSWKLSGNYSFFSMQSLQKANVEEVFRYPMNMVNLQSGWNLGKNVTFDVMLRYIDSLNSAAPPFSQTPSTTPPYLLGDIRLAWQPNKHAEFSVVGQNLFAGPHYEFTGLMVNPTEVEPGVYGMISYRY
jgi:iron complex outermembrane recepter protein